MNAKVTLLAALCASLFLPALASAQNETLLRQPLASVAGRDFTLLRITLPPMSGNGDPERGHRHPGDTIVYVESGTVTNQMGDGPSHDYHAGEFWVEGPEELHAVFRNNDPAEPAVVVVFMITGTGEPLTHR